MVTVVTPITEPPGKVFDVQDKAQTRTRFLTFMNQNLTILRALGVYPLKHSSMWTRLSPTLLAYNIALNLVLVPTTSYITFFIKDFQDLSLISTTIRSMNVVIFAISLILFSFRLIRSYKQMRIIFYMIESAEKRLSSLGTYFSYGVPPFLYTLLTLLFWAGSIIMKGHSESFQYSFKELVAYYMQLLHTINLFGFTTLLYAVEVQMANTTDHLLWVMNNHARKNRMVELSEGLVEVHDDLCTICSVISNFYSLQLLFTVTAGFVSFVANAYFSVTARSSLVKIFIHLCEALIGITQSFMVCSSSVNLCTKAKKFNSLLYQLMIDDKTNEISENKKLRLHISMKRDVAFSACGFFNLDYTLIHSMVAAATTYLVILVQFGQPGDGQDSQPTLTNTTSLASTTFHTTTPSH